MKYVAVLVDKKKNPIKEFWFRSQYNTLDMDKAFKSAEDIANSQGYKYDDIWIHLKGDNNG